MEVFRGILMVSILQGSRSYLIVIMSDFIHSAYEII